MSLINNISRSERYWGFARIIVVILFLLILTQFGRLLFTRIDTGIVIEDWQANNSFLQSLPTVLQSFLAYLFSGTFLRYLYFPLAAFIGAILLLARYIQATYELPRFRLGIRYVLAALFGVGYSSLRIEDGKKELDINEINLLDLKGGPGIVQVRPGSVVLIENLEKPVRVLSTGNHFVSQGEMIKDVNSLEDQHGFIEQVPATTKDGIPIQVRDIHFRYRVRSGLPPWYYADRTPDQPYPFSTQAVRDIAYNRTVGSQGTSSWQESVRLAVQSAITDYVSSHRIDDLTAPPVMAPNPRANILERLSSIRSRARLRKLGADLLWVDIGHFDILMKDERDPRPKKWGEKWDGVSKTERAFGEGERFYYEELGRAEAQSELIISILESLRKASLSEDPRRNLQKIILMRTAQILEAMAEKKPKPELPTQTSRPRRRPRRRRRR